MSQKKVTFRSLRFKNHRIVLDPKTKKEVHGQLITTSLTGKFPDHPFGLTVEFENGLYETSDAVIIEALKEHEDYGSMFDSTDEKTVVPKPEALLKQAQKDVVAAQAGNTDPNQCQTCGETMKNAAGLKVHMRSHQQ